MAKSETPEAEPAAEPKPAPPAPRPQASAPAKPKTVTVHCGIANGFVMSHMGGGHKITDRQLEIPVDVHKNWTIPLKAGPNPGIDAGKWALWASENADFSAVVSGHIYATED